MLNWTFLVCIQASFHFVLFDIFIILGKSGFRYDSLLSKLVSYTLLAISMPIFLNILDLYFLKQVYNQCEKQADGVKALLSEEAYRARKR